MVMRNGEPRSQHIDRLTRTFSYECGQSEPFPTRHIPGRFKVQMPPNRVRYVRQ